MPVPRKFNKEQVEVILASYYCDDRSMRDIANEYDTSPNVIYLLVSAVNYQEIVWPWILEHGFEDKLKD